MWVCVCVIGVRVHRHHAVSFCFSLPHFNVPSFPSWLWTLISPTTPSSLPFYLVSSIIYPSFSYPLLAFISPSLIFCPLTYLFSLLLSSNPPGSQRRNEQSARRIEEIIIRKRIVRFFSPAWCRSYLFIIYFGFLFFSLPTLLLFFCLRLLSTSALLLILIGNVDSILLKHVQVSFFEFHITIIINIIGTHIMQHKIR